MLPAPTRSMHASRSVACRCSAGRPPACRCRSDDRFECCALEVSHRPMASSSWSACSVLPRIHPAETGRVDAIVPCVVGVVDTRQRSASAAHLRGPRPSVLLSSPVLSCRDACRHEPAAPRSVISRENSTGLPFPWRVCLLEG